MPTIRIPHFSDNYFEICSSLSAIISIYDAINSKQNEIVDAITRNEVYDDDPEVNSSISSDMQAYTEQNVARLSVYSYILLICSGIEKAIRLFQKDGADRKNKTEEYGEYLKRLGLMPEITELEINQTNDLFILRHWISHRNGRINLQRVSEKEKSLLERASDNVFNEDEYIFVKYDYVNRIAKVIEDILKKMAKNKYE